MLVVVESQTGIFSFNIETPFYSERGVDDGSSTRTTRCRPFGSFNPVAMGSGAALPSSTTAWGTYTITFLGEDSTIFLYMLYPSGTL